jgi:hypothetical protein
MSQTFFKAKIQEVVLSQQFFGSFLVLFANFKAKPLRTQAL